MTNRVLKLKDNAEVGEGMPLQAGQEIEVVQNVIYINGNILAPNFQELFMNWIEKNPTLFYNDTRDW